jgi:GAF domain-containing protein
MIEPEAPDFEHALWRLWARYRAAAPVSDHPEDIDEQLDAEVLESMLEHLHGLLARETHRAAALDAIRTTAADMVGLAQVDDVLASSIRHIQTLTGAEIAYVSLYDEESGVNSVRAAVGTRSPDFHGTQVPYGIGLGGIVAKTGASFVSDDYLADGRLNHLPEVDSTMRREGIRAVIASPMVVRGRVVGALYTADREPRRYSTDEVEIMEAFASLAAVALENARLFEERAASLQSMEQAYESLSNRNDEAQQGAHVHRRLVSILIAGGKLTEAVRVLSEALDIPVTAFDDLGRAVVTVVPPGTAGFGPDITRSDNIRRACGSAMKLGRAEEVIVESGAHYVCMPVAVEGSPVGTLVGRSDVPLGGMGMRAFESTGLVVTALLQSEQRKEFQRLSERSGVLTSVILGHVDPAELYDSPADDRKLMAFAVNIARRDEGSCFAARRRVLGMDGFTAIQDEVLLGVLPLRDGFRPEPFLAALLMDLDKPHAGVFAPDVGLETLSDALRELVDAVRLVEGSGNPTLQTLEDARRTTAALPLAGDQDRIVHFVDVMVGDLRRYDDAKGTDLAGTLLLYLDAGRNARKVADQLQLHYKTVQQRLDRVAQVLQLDWNDAARLLNVHVALRISVERS